MSLRQSLLRLFEEIAKVNTVSKCSKLLLNALVNSGALSTPTTRTPAELQTTHSWAMHEPKLVAKQDSFEFGGGKISTCIRCLRPRGDR